VVPPPHAQPPERHPDAPPPGSTLPSHYRLCFGCGTDHPTGLHLRVVAGEGCRIHAQLAVSEHHQGAPGLAHGGLLAAAFDEALGAVTWLLRRPVVTAHLETDYRAPVPVGSVMHIDASCDAVAGRKVYSSAVGRLGSAEGPVAVQARAVFVVVPLEHFRQHGRPEDLARFAASSDLDVNQRAFEVNP
jgi:acyl-coenzyme A thioesterase PaaI-like protein